MRARRLLPPAAMLVALAAPGPAGAAEIDVVGRNLDNPRHVAVDHRGDVWVAEAGRGAPPGPGASCFDSAEGPACVGATGAVTRIRDANSRRPSQRRVVTGLASFAPASGDDAIGPHGIVAEELDIYVTNGGPTAPERNGAVVPRTVLAAENPVSARFGTVLRLRRDDRSKFVRVADVWAFEAANNPDRVIGNPLVDSNPVDVAVDGRRLLVADAGGNSLLRSRAGGELPSAELTVLSLFGNRTVANPMGGPPVPMNAVPTAVIRRRNAYYVGQLTGFPFPLRGAWIWRVDRRTGAAKPFLFNRFTNIMDLAVDRRGRLYVLEIDHNGLLAPGSRGALYRVSGNRAVRIDTPGQLTAPGGMDIGEDGEIYVTNRTTDAGAGQVLRVTP